MADKFKQKDQGYVGGTHSGPGRRESQDQLNAVRPSGHASAAAINKASGPIKDGAKQVGQGYVGTGGGRREAQHGLDPITPRHHVASAETSAVPQEYRKQRPQLKAPTDFDGDYDGDKMPGC